MNAVIEIILTVGMVCLIISATAMFVMICVGFYYDMRESHIRYKHIKQLEKRWKNE